MDWISELNIGELPKDITGAKYVARYLTLPKYCLLILRNILFVPNVTLFSDKSECRYPDAQFKWLLSDGTHKETNGQEFMDKLTQINLEAEKYFASCWYNSDDGSPNETMWSAYADDGVFVVFEKEKLISAILNSSYRPYSRDQKQQVTPCGYGPVEYYGHVQFADQLAAHEILPHPAFAKRRAFHPENEFRIVFDRSDFENDPQNGLTQPDIGFGLHFERNIEEFGLVRIVYKSKQIKTAIHAIRDTLAQNCNRALPEEIDSDIAAAYGVEDINNRGW